MGAHRGRTVSRAEFVHLWNDHGLTLVEIGRELGISAQAVRFRAMARGLPERPRYPRERVHLVKPEQEAEFSSMWLAGVGVHEMADHFGTKHQRIGRTATRLGLPKRNLTRWNKISLKEWRERELAKCMAGAAAKEQRAAVEMWRRAA